MSRPLTLLVALVAALAVGACSTPAAPPLTDPNEILTKSVQAMTQAKSAHFTAVVTGTFSGAGLPGAPGGAEIRLDGTTIEGDMDIAGKRFRATFSVPAFLGLTGEIIQVGQTTYFKSSLTGPQYQKETSDEIPVDEVTDPAKAVENLRKVLDLPGVSPTKIEDARCGDNKDCYQVRIELTAEELAALASEEPVPGGDTQDVSVTMTFGVEKESLRMSRFVLSMTMGKGGSVDVTIDLSKWDEAVVISEPPADQVAP